ncbi:uncharacterized protein LOC129590211 [Paramacrobiotus metropolitanus]|uniref:uncharacterized protein LOC129590211 n=1 Tax=Paramacrobiotus metropolitanus TaxID=2943436 RepID=UPI002445DA49|nr:uncharacterized protein LOC129590211 [Paramacrobiotus metropolitanus]
MLALQCAQRVLLGSRSAAHSSVRYNNRTKRFPRPASRDHLPPNKRGDAHWIRSKTIKEPNHTGIKAMSVVMPDVIKISRERRPHLFDQDGRARRSLPNMIPPPEALNEESTGEPKKLSDASAPTDAIQTRGGASDRGEAAVYAEDGSVSVHEAGNRMAKVPEFARFAEFRESHLDFDPAKLHVVWRVKTMAGRQKYEKKIMVDLQLDRPMNEMVLIKNTPATNAKLWMVKHLIRMKPFVIPDPKSVPTEENYKGMLLKRNGEFVPSKYYRDNYFRAVNRPELERYVMLTSDKEPYMRKVWFKGSKDGSLLNHWSSDGAANPTREGGELKKFFIPGSENWDREKRWKEKKPTAYDRGGDLAYHKIGS